MWYQSQGARDRGIKQGLVCRKYKKIRNWFVSSKLTAGLFSNSDISFVNRWIGPKFFVELLYTSMKISTGGIFNLRFYVKVLVCRKLLQREVLYFNFF